MIVDKESFKGAYLGKLERLLSTTGAQATLRDKYVALAGLVMDIVNKNRLLANARNNCKKKVYYLSMEFLPGKSLKMHLLNLGIRGICTEGLSDLGIDIREVEEFEDDPGLGSGGLGRLASGFLDSLAALKLPGYGCGIRYRHGYFTQKIVHGYQVELSDEWVKEGHLWETKRTDEAVRVKFGGNVRTEFIKKYIFTWENYTSVLAVPYDIPVTGYQNNTVNTLRLWDAGDDSISKTLYPDDSSLEGKILRLKQEYFLVSASLQNIVKNHKRALGFLKTISSYVAIHINDTHPALAVPELMRILMDEEGMGWNEAWQITIKIFSYTNHTTLAEALEKWPVEMLKSVLPRIYMIIEEINTRFCKELARRSSGNAVGMPIIFDGHVQMANLALVGSHSVNGVSMLHTQILKKKVMQSFFEYYPQKFNNKTNGINHRRWLLSANPLLAELITASVGAGWIEEPAKLLELLRYVEDEEFLGNLFRVKQNNKNELVQLIKNKYNFTVDVDSIFDIQIKRIHAYKRQILNVLHIMHLYQMLKEDTGLDIIPRTFIFSGKAAPGYHLAKLTIKLITSLAVLINNDSALNDKIKVIFLEDYKVSLAEKIFPAADVSEQISTASKEASGTGNIKSIMNGALIIGTEDGANVEIKDEVGEDNIFLFGLTEGEVLNYYQHEGHNAQELYNTDATIKGLLDNLVNGFLPAQREEFRDLYNYLLYNDEFFVLQDFSAYVEAQKRVEQAYGNHQDWLQMSAINIAHSGRFSSDRTILEYATDIWHIN